MDYRVTLFLLTLLLMSPFIVFALFCVLLQWAYVEWYNRQGERVMPPMRGRGPVLVFMMFRQKVQPDMGPWLRAGLYVHKGLVVLVPAALVAAFAIGRLHPIR